MFTMIDRIEMNYIMISHQLMELALTGIDLLARNII